MSQLGRRWEYIELVLRARRMKTSSGLFMYSGLKLAANEVLVREEDDAL